MACTIKLFTAVTFAGNNPLLVTSTLFKHLQARLELTRVEPLTRHNSNEGGLKDLPPNIRLGWRRLILENTLAYYNTAKFSTVKGLYYRTWGQSYKTFYVRKLRIFVISYSVCPLHAFPSSNQVCR